MGLGAIGRVGRRARFRSVVALYRCVLLARREFWANPSGEECRGVPLFAPSSRCAGVAVP